MLEKFATLAQITAAVEDVIAEDYEGEAVDWPQAWADVEDRMGIELNTNERDAVLRILAA